MIDFLKTMEENAATISDKVLFVDAPGHEVSYGEFYELTGRVYAYLKARGIGREDFVLVCLPRGVNPIAASCGVLRAGAAFVIVEDTLPADRIAYIAHDCACKLVIDAACWREVLATDPMSGYEQRDDHSAAFAVYTSGTTGAPKGVLHEYGNVARMIGSSPLPEGPAVARFALCSPLNFVLSTLASLVLVYTGTTTVYVVPFAVVKDPRQFKMFLVENGITFSFLSPLFVKKMPSVLSSLAFCVVGAEPANDVFSTDFAILNGYTMSEAGFIIGAFVIDKPYPNTPVGKPVFDCPTRLLDEDGVEVAPGEKGEIVVANSYVRGYMNLPEKTAAAFKDGWYHTGDLGMYDSEGRLVVCGRFDDMAKVNGNRVEPGEIEIVARRVLGLDWAAAKIFTSEEKSFICVYYLEDKPIDTDWAREKMAEQLPAYMLPSFFIHIDEVPLTAAGKFNRRALQAPVLESDRAAYCAPENDVQRALCDAFSRALGVAHVGIKDDFARLGGDSLGAMEVVVASGLDGLSTADVYQGKTPEGIAALYAAHATQVDFDAVNAQALTKSFPLTPDQASIVELQLSEPESTMRSIHSLMKLDKNVLDMEKMAAALVAAARNHPALLTELYYADDGQLRQRFTPAFVGDIAVERMSEAEFAQVKETLVRPFTMIGTPLFRARVFETETAGYVFVDVHHAVFDGASHGILLADVMAAYQGKELSRDYYPYLLETLVGVGAADDAAGQASYFAQRYDGEQWCRNFEVVGSAEGSAICTLQSVVPATEQQLVQVEKSRGVTRNGLFALAAARALAQCEGASKVMLFWSFNGRTNARELNTIGSLRVYLPLAFSFDTGASVDDLLASVNEQIGAGIAHCREGYVALRPEMVEAGIVRVLYQGSMGAAPKMPGFMGSIPLGRAAAASRMFVNVEVNERDGGFVSTIRYTQNCFDSEKMTAFEQYFGAAVKELVG